MNLISVYFLCLVICIFAAWLVQIFAKDEVDRKSLSFVIGISGLIPIVDVVVAAGIVLFITFNFFHLLIMLPSFIRERKFWFYSSKNKF